MPRQIKFARKFPDKHIDKGKPTYFVEKILNSLGIDYRNKFFFIHWLFALNRKSVVTNKISITELETFSRSLNPDITDCKPHTIRESKIYKKGDIISLAVWSDKAYRSSPIIFAETKIDEVLPVTIVAKDKHVFIPDLAFYDESYTDYILPKLSKNDGLTPEQFESWFSEPFVGNIIMWKEVIY